MFAPPTAIYTQGPGLTKFVIRGVNKVEKFKKGLHKTFDSIEILSKPNLT